jgi:hypothetical protein
MFRIHSYYNDQALAHASHSCAQKRRNVPTPPRLGGTLPDTSSPISNRDVAGAVVVTEAAPLDERTTAALVCSMRRARAERE